MLPWICTDNWNDSWEAVKGSKSQVMMGHLELNGFEMHRGAFCDSGFDREEFRKFDQVFSGHFHHRSTEGNISYLGCPYEMTWSDFEDQKGFHVYDTETRELEFVPNPLQMFYKFNYDDSDMTIEGLDDIDFSIFDSTYIKLIVKNKKDPYLFDLFVDRIEKAGVQNLQIIEDVLNLDMDNEDGIIDEAKSTMEMLEGYVDQIETAVSKKKLKGLFHNLYSEALTLE
jgi:DNA repair exonuclease SbcCD nuclease subunit